MTACGCGSKTGYHTYACPLRYNGTVLEEDIGAAVRLMEDRDRAAEAACMRLYDQVYDAMGSEATPEQVTRVAVRCLEVAMDVADGEGAQAATGVIQRRLDWFSSFAPR